MTLTPPTDIIQLPPSNAACNTDLRRAQRAKNSPRSTSAPRAPSTAAAQSCPSRARALRPAPHNPDIMRKPVSMRAGGYPDCSWARRSARAMPCQRASKVSASRGTSGAGQGGYPAAAQSALTRVRGAECAQGVVWALRDGLRGHARAVLATSLLHMLAHLYLANYRHEDGRENDPNDCATGAALLDVSHVSERATLARTRPA